MRNEITHFESGSLPDGIFYGPCAGRDIDIALRLFGDAIDTFIFCDLAYDRGTTAAASVPAGWILEDRMVNLGDFVPMKHLDGRRRQSVAVAESWKRVDGSRVQIDLRAEDAVELLNALPDGSITGFLHITDGMSEGGSGLLFLASSEPPRPFEGREQDFLLGSLLPKLCRGAIVVTDGTLADRRFAQNTPFRFKDAAWEPVPCMISRRVFDRDIRVWQLAHIFMSGTN